MLGCGFWGRSMYLDLNPNGNWDEYSDQFDDIFLDFDEYCAVVEELRATCSRGPGSSRVSAAQLYGQPGSYSPVQGYGPGGGPGLFHDPGCYGHASMYDSPSSPVEQPSELLEPRQFLDLRLPPTLPQQHCEPGSCSCSSYVIRCPGSPPQQSDPEESEKDLEDA